MIESKSNYSNELLLREKTRLDSNRKNVFFIIQYMNIFTIIKAESLCAMMS